MAYSKIIVMPTYQRPAYTLKVLEGLKSCYGIDKYKILIHAEPGFPEVLDVINKITGLDKEIHINPVRIGCNKNIFVSLKHGFELSDFVIIFEDDIVPTNDCLEFFEWARNKYAEDKNILNICGYNKDFVKPKDFFTAFRANWFTPWGWGTWKDRWEEIASKWNFEDKSAGWDFIVNYTIRKNRNEIRPILARVQNIGAELGYNVPSFEWHRKNQYNEFWVKSVNIESRKIGKFYETKNFFKKIYLNFKLSEQLKKQLFNNQGPVASPVKPVEVVIDRFKKILKVFKDYPEQMIKYPVLRKRFLSILFKHGPYKAFQDAYDFLQIKKCH